MGVESFLLASSVMGVLAQRLIRLLCPQCKVENKAVTDEIRRELDIPLDAVIYKAVGCNNCSNTGYKGRNGIHELLVVDDNIQRMIHSNEAEKNIEEYAIKNLGMRTLRMDASRWLIEGKTSLEEVLTITKE
jgi:general secretion pathway protein E